MTPVEILCIAPLFTITAIITFKSLYSWYRHRSSANKMEAFFMCSIAIWIFGFLLELGSQSVPAKIFWSKAQYIGRALLPTAWLGLLALYTGREQWFSRRNLALINIIPMITLLLVFTNDAHGLIWTGFEVVTRGPLILLEGSRGIGLWIFIIYFNLMLLSGSLLMINKSNLSWPFYRRQTIVLLTGIFFPVLASLLESSDFFSNLHMDLEPFALAVTGIVVLWCRRQLGLGDISPVARESIIENMSDEVMVLDARGNILDLNPAAQRFIGLTTGKAIGKPLEKIWPELHEQIGHIEGLAGLSREIELPGNNKQYIYDISISPLADRLKRPVSWVIVLRDITRRKQMEEQLKSLSYSDSLTGLYNRSFFELKMARLKEKPNALAGIIVCDIDGLKLINDSMGHQKGDELLLNAANIIRQCFRQEDVIARIGGDEFAVLISTGEGVNVEKMCRRIRNAVDRYNADKPELPLSISVGSSINDYPCTDIEELFKEADDNMYREKLHRKQSVRSGIARSLNKTLESRDFINKGKGQRMQELVVNFAAGLPESKKSDLGLFAQFHDIGKVGIPDRVMFKTGPLTREEYAEMQRHCEIGYRIAQSAVELAPIADWILKHHEWWNGQGYPLGLKGEDIPIECRILSIADAYYAMTSHRPYRRALSHGEALAELKRCSGTQFDPSLVSIFIDFITTPGVEARPDTLF